MHKNTPFLWILKEPVSKNCLHMPALIMLLHETMQNYNETSRKQANKYLYIYIYIYKYCILYMHTYFPLRQPEEGEMLFTL